MEQRIPLVVVDGYPGVGIIKQETAYYAVILFRLYKHSWEIIAERDEYEIIGYIYAPHRILEES